MCYHEQKLRKMQRKKFKTNYYVCLWFRVCVHSVGICSLLYVIMHACTVWHCASFVYVCVWKRDWERKRQSAQSFRISNETICQVCAWSASCRVKCVNVCVYETDVRSFPSFHLLFTEADTDATHTASHFACQSLCVCVWVCVPSALSTPYLICVSFHTTPAETL